MACPPPSSKCRENLPYQETIRKAYISWNAAETKLLKGVTEVFTPKAASCIWKDAELGKLPQVPDPVTPSVVSHLLTSWCCQKKRPPKAVATVSKPLRSFLGARAMPPKSSFLLRLTATKRLLIIQGRTAHKDKVSYVLR